MAQQDIRLSNNILVHCPERGFVMRKVLNCLGCDYYKGLKRATQGGEPIQGNEANDFQVICARPISRKLIQISED